MAAELRCAHLPTTEPVYRVSLALVGTQADRARATGLVCQRCARAIEQLLELAAETPPEPKPAGPRSRAGNWYVTIFALERYAHVRRASPTPALQHELEQLLLEGANYKETDTEGRELWRCPPSLGGLRIVVSYAHRPEGPLPQVVWVGQGRPPIHHWTPY